MEKVVSVVIPVYNVEAYLDRCLNSVVNQSYRDLEIILVDDGSTDNCPALCDAWARRDSRIKVIHKENAGLGMARNTGIENAAGKYICFFDSDDYVAPQILERAVSLSEKENADITVFGMAKMSAKGELRNEFVPQTDKAVFRGREVQDIFLPDLINSSSGDAAVKNVSLSMCVCLFRRELIERSGWRLVSEREIISEDSYSLMRLYKDVQCVTVLPEVGYYYCNNQTSLTQMYRADRFEKIKQFYFKAVELQEELGYSKKIKERLGRLFLAFIVGAMKQIAVSDRSWRERLRDIETVIRDELVQKILHTLDIQCYGIKIRFLFSAMRRKMVLPTLLLAWVQVMMGKQNAAG